MNVSTEKLSRFVLRQDGSLVDDDECNRGEQHKFLRNALSSGHLNVMLGSGFSFSVVPTLGGRESWFRFVEEQMTSDSTNDIWMVILKLLKAEYFRSIMLPLEKVDADPGQLDAVRALMNLIHRRGTTTIPKRINLFTTNYDPLLEKSLEHYAVAYNDGFIGRERPSFSPSAFSRLQYEQSLFMEYSTQVATANVIKLHGSLTWASSEDGLIYSKTSDTLHLCLAGCEAIRSMAILDEVKKMAEKDFSDNDLENLKFIASKVDDASKTALERFNRQYDSTLCIVNPTKKKFMETVLERSYYDLLRIYSNELDRNNSILLTFGFSFADEHIRELTIRAAKSNPKLLIFISCFSHKDALDMEGYFNGCGNVSLFVAEDKNKHIGLDAFAKGLECLSR